MCRFWLIIHKQKVHLFFFLLFLGFSFSFLFLFAPRLTFAIALFVSTALLSIRSWSNFPSCLAFLYIFLYFFAILVGYLCSSFPTFCTRCCRSVFRLSRRSSVPLSRTLYRTRDHRGSGMVCVFLSACTPCNESRRPIYRKV